MGLLAAGIVVFCIALPTNVYLVLLGSGLTGLALGATVAPALFVAGFSLQSNSLQRVFAIIELLRAVAAFMVAPILAHFAATAVGGLTAGTIDMLWLGFGLSIAGAVFAVAIYLLSGARPQTPDLDEFLDGECPAWDSPPLLARLRGIAHTPRQHHAEPQVAQEDLIAPVLFAYDGTTLAARAIQRAAEHLGTDRDALVVCVWRPVDVGFIPVDDAHFDADQATEVRAAAERTAARGASLAAESGFRARGIAVEATPSWHGIVEAADAHHAGVIVLGPHRRSGVLGHLHGSVAADVIAHATVPVLVVPEDAGGGVVAPRYDEAAAAH